MFVCLNVISFVSQDTRRKGLMDKIHMVQEVVLTVQSILDEIANIGERVKK